MKKIGKKIIILIILMAIVISYNNKTVYAEHDIITFENAAVNFICKLFNNENLSLNAYSFLDLTNVNTYEELRAYIVKRSKEDESLIKTAKHKSEAEFDGTFKQRGISIDMSTIKVCLQDATLAEKMKGVLDSNRTGGGPGTYDKFYKSFNLVMEYNEKENGQVNVEDKENPEQNGWETLESGEKKFKINGEYAIGWTRIKTGTIDEYYYFGEDGIMYAEKYSPSGYYLKKNGQWDRVKPKEEKITGTDTTSSTNTNAPQHYNDIQEEIEEEIQEEKKTISGTILLGSAGAISGNNEKIDPDDYTPGQIESPERITKIAQVIIDTIKIVGVVIAVIALILIGYKYMTGSISEKAEYKKTLIPYIVGIILLANLGWIIELISNMIINIKV